MWIAGLWFGMKSLKGGCMFTKIQWHTILFLQGYKLSAELALCFVLGFGVLWFTSTGFPCTLFFLTGFLRLLSAPHGIRHSYKSQKISWINWKCSLEHNKKQWCMMDLWELDPYVRAWPLGSSCCQGPEENIKPKMGAQRVQSTIKHLNISPQVLYV